LGIVKGSVGIGPVKAAVAANLGSAMLPTRIDDAESGKSTTRHAAVASWVSYWAAPDGPRASIGHHGGQPS
jgi:hypothetical protein